MSESTEDLRSQVEELESRVEKLEELAKEGNLRDDTPAMREYVEAANPNSHVERAVVIGHFLERYGGESSFNTNDVSGGYETCRVPTASNMSDVLLRAEERGLIMVVDSESQQKEWRVTAEGERFVEDLRQSNQATES
ncbi:hypothetical protein SAMN04487950_2859 [Halogranum rubrum]|uniref:HTH marR-type domain-containing protein n=1 Tax=Halogranum rubrum TaxID=553466 RepID=A0A1I4FV76_9EURY|nr:hypothetical protein [Halogranum rubrum]SFL21768.1 hypothetical protein SAMN04487950_2859 [Halogranum rubrum]